MLSSTISRRRLLAVAGATVLGGCAARSTDASSAFDWPQFGRTPAKTNANPDANLAISDGTPEWSRPVGGGILTSLVASDGLVCFGTDGALAAHGISDGDRRWRGDLRGTPTGTPAVSDGRVVGTSVDRPTDVDSSGGEIAAFDFSSGDRRWHHDLPDAGYVFSPTIASDGVTVRTAERALGLDLTSGDVAWELSGLDAFEDPTYPGLADLSPAVHEGVAYVPNPDGIVAYDTQAQTVGWQQAVPKVRSAPSVAGDRLFVSSVTTGLYAIDASTGDIEWHWKSTGCWTTPAVTADAVFTTANGSLVALDRADGSRRWEFDLHGDAYGAPLVVGDTVVATSIGRASVGVEIESGNSKWVFAGDGTRNTPAAVDGHLYVPDGDRSLTALLD